MAPFETPYRSALHASSSFGHRVPGGSPYARTGSDVAGVTRSFAIFTWASLPVIVIIGATRAQVLTRFGLLAEMTSAAVWTLFMTSPMTLQTSAWYAELGYAAFALVGTIAIYGFTTALGERRILEGAAIGD